MTFKPGQSGNPNGRRRGRRDNKTIERDERMRELSRKIGRAANAHELLIKMYEDPDVPLDMRRDAASIALRFEKPALSLTNDPSLVELIRPGGRTIVDLSNLDDAERGLLAKLMGKVLPTESNVMGPLRPMIAVPAPDERAELLAALSKYESPEEIERLRNERTE